MKFIPLIFILGIIGFLTACNSNTPEENGETPSAPLGYIDVSVYWCNTAEFSNCEDDDYIPHPGIEIVLYETEMDANEAIRSVKSTVTNSEGKANIAREESAIFYIKANSPYGSEVQAVSVAPNTRSQVLFYFAGE